MSIQLNNITMLNLKFSWRSNKLVNVYNDEDHEYTITQEYYGHYAIPHSRKITTQKILAPTLVMALTRFGEDNGDAWMYEIINEDPDIADLTDEELIDKINSTNDILSNEEYGWAIAKDGKTLYDPY